MHVHMQRKQESSPPTTNFRFYTQRQKKTNFLITATLHYCGDKCLLPVIMSVVTRETKPINHGRGPSLVFG